jgi:hypothetical protein
MNKLFQFAFKQSVPIDGQTQIERVAALGTDTRDPSHPKDWDSDEE